MADTYTLIEKITVGAAGASSVTFTSIPQTYTDLKIVMSVRTNLGSGNIYDIMNVAVNGGSTKIAYTSVYGNGSTTSSEKYTTASNINWSGYPQANGGTASVFSNVEYYFPNYTGSNKKSFSWDNVVENNATSVITALGASLWDGTSAITSIEFSSANAANFLQYSTFYLYGIAKEGVNPSLSSAPYATGGDKILYDGTYWYHAFTSTGTFTPKKGLSCDILVVAGGGAGGRGGGGAGGLLAHTAQSLTNNTAYTVTVGAGGAQRTTDGGGLSNAGNNSQFGSLTASVGGGAAAGYNVNGGNGGSGGGAGWGSGAYSGGTATSGQGNNGGNNGTGDCAGGGGGAGAVGTNGATNNPGTGGAGSSTYSSWGLATSTGENSSGTVYYAGGGGGSGNTSQSNKSGGLGGGGTGVSSSGGTPTAGTANTGGGGGGGSGSTSIAGASGGSGIVIVRYAA